MSLSLPKPEGLEEEKQAGNCLQKDVSLAKALALLDTVAITSYIINLSLASQTKGAVLSAPEGNEIREIGNWNAV